MSTDQKRVLDLLKDSLTAEASDIIVKVPGRPMFRSGGRLIPTPYPELQPEQTFAFARSLLQIARIERPLARIRDETFAFGVQDLGRFRAHLYRQRGSLAIVIHRISLAPPTLSDLAAPPDTSTVAWGGPGLTLVTGRSERLPILAALMNDFNRTRRGHLVSLEDPIEYLHKDQEALLSQREVGEDVESFLKGLQGLQRESADALVIHDISDSAVAEAVLRVSEGGLSVVAGLAGCRPSEATRWFTRMFPAHRTTEFSERLCIALRGVIAGTDGATHVLPSSESVRAAILNQEPLAFPDTPAA